MSFEKIKTWILNLIDLKTSQKIQIKKTVSWNLTSSIITFFAGWIVSGDILIGVGTGVLDRVVKVIYYYLHERYWHGKYKEAKKATK